MGLKSDWLKDQRPQNWNKHPCKGDPIDFISLYHVDLNGKDVYLGTMCSTQI